jgi:three-Cys-motif partner protein
MLRNLADDGSFVHPIKLHSLDKIVRHNYYVSMFATAMKNKWPQRAYLGLYSGPGRARVETTGEIIETTPMGAVRVQDRFSHYVFVDDDERATAALERRIAATGLGIDVKTLTGDVNQLVPEIQAALPAFSREHGLLSFCFVDPFAADLKFSTIRQLATYRMDFLILLMLGWDARTNFRKYFEDETDTRIAQLIDCPDWREQYRDSGERVVRFLLRKFDEAMTGLGYFSCSDDLVHQVKISGKNVFLYSLVLYSRSQVGQEFWRDTLRRSDPQLGFDL